MTDSKAVEESIKHSIGKKGFPDKIVRLPFKPVYDACKNRNTSLKNVLDNLREEEIFGTIHENHIEFQSREKLKETSNLASGPNPESKNCSWMNGVPDLGNLREMTQEYLSKMTPEQMAEIRKTVENLSDEEKKNLLQMFTQNIDPNKL